MGFNFLCVFAAPKTQGWGRFEAEWQTATPTAHPALSWVLVAQSGTSSSRNKPEQTACSAGFGFASRHKVTPAALTESCHHPGSAPSLAAWPGWDHGSLLPAPGTVEFPTCSQGLYFLREFSEGVRCEKGRCYHDVI